MKYLLFLSDNLFTEFVRKYSSDLITTAVVVGVSILAIVVCKIITTHYIKNKDSKGRSAASLAKMLFNIGSTIVVIFAILMILYAWGFNITPLLVGLGIVALAVGIGAHRLIGDLIDGISIIFGNQYAIDDVVEINGFKGRVLEIGIRTTKVINWKNELKIFYHGSITSVINYSRFPSVAVVDVSVGHDVDLDKLFTVLDEKFTSMRELYPQIIEGPNISGVTKLNNNCVDVRIVFKTEPEKQYEVERGLRKLIKEIFDEEGIKIPLSQIEVHYDK